MSQFTYITKEIKKSKDFNLSIYICNVALFPDWQSCHPTLIVKCVCCRTFCTDVEFLQDDYFVCDFVHIS